VDPVTIADEVKALRAVLEEDTATFGARFHKSGRTIEGWEQGRRQPDGLALELLRSLAVRRGTKKAKPPNGSRR
jgi:DNA-binding transcriptional regulator YiaG